MTSRFATLLITAAVAMSPAAYGSGKKEEKASISFHIETEASDNPKMIFPQLANGKTRYFRRLPEVGTKDILSFSPFSSEHSDYGVVFKLKSARHNRYSAITNTNQGRWMIAQLNGRVVDGFQIDKQVDDGVLVVWKGVTLADIAILDSQFPRIGEEGKKKKKD